MLGLNTSLGVARLTLPLSLLLKLAPSVLLNREIMTSYSLHIFTKEFWWFYYNKVHDILQSSHCLYYRLLKMCKTIDIKPSHIIQSISSQLGNSILMIHSFISPAPLLFILSLFWSLLTHIITIRILFYSKLYP